MDPFRPDPPRPPDTSRTPDVGAAGSPAPGAPVPDEFSKLLDKELKPPDPTARRGPQDPLNPIVEEQERVVRERLEQGPSTPRGDLRPEDIESRLLEKHKIHEAGGRTSRGGIPVPPFPPEPPWRTLPQPTHDPQGLPMPHRRKKEQAAEARVDGELIEALLGHGLRDPVSSLDDPRMRTEAAFSPPGGWIQVLGESGLSATWRSPKDPAGAYQMCVVTEGRRIIETMAQEKMQRIEERLGTVSISRRQGPPPEFAPD